jgi:hypothetical protein
LESLEDRTLLSSSLPLSPTSWTALGPAPVSGSSGRIAAIAADPSNANVIYIGAAGGGVFKTTDGGNTWTPLTDHVTDAAGNPVPMFTGALAVAPSNDNVVYAGTGEANMGPSKLAISRDNVYYGEGILKSTDAGATWTLEGQSDFNRRTISRIVVDPSDPNTVYAAVGALATNGLPGNTGIWKSTDGGSTWTDLTTGISTTAAFSDLAMDPANHLILYAAVGDPNGSDPANGLYETTDGGTTWSRAGNFPTGSDANVGRVDVALSAANPSVIYATIAHSGSNASLYEMLRSTDGGSTWSVLSSAPNFMGSFGDYNIALAVDPSNASTVYAGGQAGSFTLIRSTDGGNSWTDIGNLPNGPHVDHHAATFDASGRFLNGNDGGIWRFDPSTSTWTDINGNLNTVQIEGIALDPTTPNVAYAGSQDNGTEKFNDGLAWNEIDGGDGGKVLVDFNNPQTVYHDAAVASFGPADFIQKSTDGGNTWTSVTNGINAGSEPSVFYPPMVMDPANSSRLLLGTSRVYETTNGAAQWNPLSTPGVAGWSATAAIDAIGVAKSDPNTIYATAGGSVFVTTNHGSTWTEVDPVPSLPAGLRFNDITVDPTNAQVAYIVARTFDDVSGGHVWRTTNGGATWTNISGNLPDFPTWSVALNPNASGSSDDVLYVGSDVGVYFSTNLGVSWSRLEGNLPNALVRQLVLDPNQGILAAGTHGRGMWEINTVHFSVTASTAAALPGVPFSVTVTALNPSNQVITNFAGTAHLASSDGAATLPSDYTFTGSEGGTHTFTGVVLRTAGSETITASDPVTSAAVGSATVTIGTVIEGFESGNLNAYTVVGATTPTAVVSTAAAHDGTYGLDDLPGNDWIYRNDAAAHVQAGDVISVWVKTTAKADGRAMFGFGATAGGTLSLAIAPGTKQFLLQKNINFGAHTIAAVTQTYQANHWYRMEVDWGTSGTIVGKLFDSDGTTLLNTVTGSTTVITSGGIAFKATQHHKYWDTVSVIHGGAASGPLASTTRVVAPPPAAPTVSTATAVLGGAGPDFSSVHGRGPTPVAGTHHHDNWLASWLQALDVLFSLNGSQDALFEVPYMWASRQVE